MKKSLEDARKAHPPSRKVMRAFEGQPSRVVSNSVRGILKQSNVDQLVEALTNGRKS